MENIIHSSSSNLLLSPSCLSFQFVVHVFGTEDALARSRRETLQSNSNIWCYVSPQCFQRISTAKELLPDFEGMKITSLPNYCNKYRPFLAQALSFLSVILLCYSCFCKSSFLVLQYFDAQISDSVVLSLSKKNCSTSITSRYTIHLEVQASRGVIALVQPVKNQVTERDGAGKNNPYTNVLRNVDNDNMLRSV